MSITMEETFKSRDGQAGYQGNSFDATYYTFGETDEAVALDYVKNNIPVAYQGFPLRTIDREQVTDSVYKFKANYGANVNNMTEETPILEFNVGGGTVHITNSFSKTDYVNASVLPGGVIDNKGAIGVEYDGSMNPRRVRGVEVYAASADYSYGKIFDVSDVTDAYIAGIYDLSQNPVNNATFFGRPAGSVLFRGARGTWKGSDKWEIRFDFSFSPNVTGLSVGGITGVNKTGWQYLDVIYKEGARTTDGMPVMVPAQATVHTVYNSGDFSVLGIGVA
jgi:hypothetical protein